MALFLHNDRAIHYQTSPAPFPADLVLLQGADFSPDYWRSVVGELQSQPPAGGRVLICEWQGAAGLPEPTDLIGLMQALGLQRLHVVAMDDAAGLVADVQRMMPGLIEKTLLYPSGGPRGEDLTRAVRAFWPIGI